MDNVHAVCGYCGSKILEGDEIYGCSKCRTPHHPNCWIENGKCTTYACGCGEHIRAKYKPASGDLVKVEEPDKRIIKSDAKAELLRHLDLKERYWKEYCSAKDFEKDVVEFTWKGSIEKKRFHYPALTEAGTYLDKFNEAVKERAKAIVKSKEPFLGWGWIGFMIMCNSWIFSGWRLEVYCLGLYLFLVQSYFSKKYLEETLPDSIIAAPQDYDDPELKKLVENKETALEMFAQKFQEEIEKRDKSDSTQDCCTGLMLGLSTPVKKSPKKNKFSI